MKQMLSAFKKKWGVRAWETLERWLIEHLLLLQRNRIHLTAPTSGV